MKNDNRRKSNIKTSRERSRQWIPGAVALLVIASSWLGIARAQEAGAKPEGAAWADPFGYLIGCAWDPDDPSDPILAHLYVEVDESHPDAILFGSPPAPPGQIIYLRYLSNTTADLSSNNLNNSCAEPGPHGFRLRIPNEYRDGSEHSFFVWATDPQGTSGADHTLLAQPYVLPEEYRQSATTPVNSLPFGAFDVIKYDKGQVLLHGWAIDPDQDNQPVMLHFYLEGPAGHGGFYFAQVSATEPRSSLNDWGFPGDHAFSYVLPESVSNGGENLPLTDGSLRAYFTYGINISQSGQPLGPNALLGDKHYALGQGVEVSGELETVYDHLNDPFSCDSGPILTDYVDLPVRPFRSGTELHVLAGSSQDNHQLIGTNFDDLRRDCTPSLVSDQDPDHSQYNDREWVYSVYAEGSDVYSLIHSEYHGDTHNTCDPVPLTGNPFVDRSRCNYVSITEGRSGDGGDTFSHNEFPTLVATLPYTNTEARTRDKEDHDQGGDDDDDVPFGLYSGVRDPSNIIKHPTDGFYYAMMDRRAGGRGVGCIMRTSTLAVSYWKAYKDGAFNMIFINPYHNYSHPGPYNPEDHLCDRVTPDLGGGTMTGSLQYFVETGSFKTTSRLFAGPSRDEDGDDGFYYSNSSNLTSWSDPLRIMKRRLVVTDTGIVQDTFAYPSLVDHNSTSNSFDRVEPSGTGDPHLYFMRTRNYAAGSIEESTLHDWDRVLMRIPVSFLPACNDGIDNDGDELVDFGEDPDCASWGDLSEAPGA